MTRHLSRVCCALLVLPALLFAPAASADPVADFYRGKTVTIVVAAGAGGDHTAYSRLVSVYVQKYLPGHPNFIIQNMGGAGGTRAANHLYNSAPQDGTAIGILLSDTPLAARLRSTGVKYDPKRFHYLGGADRTRSAFVVMKRAGVATMAEAMKKEVVFGSSGRGSQTFTVPTMANAFLGTKFKTVLGYRGFRGIFLAMDKGEVDGFQSVWSSVASMRPQWIDEKKVNVLAALSLDKLPDRPDVPLLIDLVKNPEDKKIVTLMAGNGVLGRCWLAPPGVPADRVAALRAAFTKALNDPALIKDAKARKKVWEPVPWQELQAQANKIADTDPALITRMQKVISGKM